MADVSDYYYVPILVWTYVRLSLREEKDMEQEFGDVCRKYALMTPRFFPHFKGPEGIQQT